MEEVKKFLGRPINNSRGDTLGRMVGIITNTKGEVISATVELVDGEFVTYPSAEIRIEHDSVSLIPKWRVLSEELKNEIQTVVRRNQALDELFRLGEVRRETYEELKGQHGAAIQHFTQERDELVKELSATLDRLKRQETELEALLANNKMQHSSGEIDDLSYKVSTEAIRAGIERILSERGEIEDFLQCLRELEAKPTKVEPIPIPSTQDVIVVKVRD